MWTLMKEEINPAASASNRVARKQENLDTVGSWELRLGERGKAGKERKQ